MPRRVSLLILLFVLSPIFSSAQNVGKLAGRVVQAVTGVPLPGTTVVVEGTNLGAATGTDGEYFILGIPVGSYSVRASFVGFEPQVFTDVEVNQDFTRELGFSLHEDVATFEEIVVQYERPLLKKDAIGVPHVVTGQEIENLPVRGIAQVAAIQGGVIAEEGREELHIRGGRDEEVIFFIDGIKVIGTTGVPQQAIQEQEMLIGSLPARYGDAMSGVISITTKSGRSDLFGTIETITSEGLDNYGYDLVSVSLGGPLLNDGLSFFAAGEFTHVDDRLPSAIDIPRIRDDRLTFLKQNPQSLRFVDPDGEKVFLPMPGEIAPSIDSDGDGRFDAVPFDEMLALMNVPDGYTLDSPATVLGLEVEPLSSYVFEGSRPNFGQDRYAASGNLTYAVNDAIRIRLGARFDRIDRTSTNSMRDLVVAFDALPNYEQTSLGVGATWTHRLSNAAFYQIRADWSRYASREYPWSFTSDVDEVLFYGDVDHPSNMVAARQRVWDPDDSLYVPKYEDGALPGDGSVFGDLAEMGRGAKGFAKDENNQLRITAEATTQLGLHQIEFGAEFERRTERHFSVFDFYAVNAARHFDDGGLESGVETVVSEYAQLPFSALAARVWGYDYLGLNQTDDGDVDTFVDGARGSCNGHSEQPDPACDTPPYRPVLYAGYAQDKIEYRDLVLNLGLRVDVFDNNALVLRDPFALVPIARAGSIADRPTNVPAEYAVYFNGDQVVGYRDLEGNYFDDRGQQVSQDDIDSQGGQVRVPTGVSGNVSSEVFEDYEPDVTWMPRVGVSFSVTNEALFFAHYDKTSQRPSTVSFAGVADYFYLTSGQLGTVGNPGLRAQTTTEYELGFRRRLGPRSALTVSGFYKKIANLIQIDRISAFPSGYATFVNSDFGTVNGVQFEFDLRRTGGVALNANYTLQYARGTGSEDRSSALASAFGFEPDFIFPLDFDRRHSINLNVDYRLGEGEGPSVRGASLLENFGFNLLARLQSGFPYTPREWPGQTVSGRLNGERIPWSTRVDLRIDRRIRLNDGLGLVAFLWIQNLLDVDNVRSVYPTTGVASSNGWLSTPAGSQAMEFHEVRVCGGECGGTIEEVAEGLYGFLHNTPWFYGIPRLTRIGLRLNF